MNYLEARLKPPAETLIELSKRNECEITDEKFCRWLDENDELADFQKQFNIPTFSAASNAGDRRLKNEEDANKCLYFCGNILGLQPKSTAETVEKVLQNWKDNGFPAYESGFLPGFKCEEFIVESLSKIVGAYKDEVIAMNNLTSNLHLLLVSFYQPKETRHKILIEQKAFATQHFVAESQIRQRGYDPETSLLIINPKQGEETWKPDDIIELIEKEGESIALVLMSGVHHYNGQLFDIKAITEAAHQKGCMVGFDLAHAVGNVELYLHDWQVDFACWCSYKYLNSGPGTIAGAFMHRNHERNNFSRFAGWWGQKWNSRFSGDNKLDLCPGIRGYCLSTQSPLLVACCRASLDLFDKTSMKVLRGKSVLLTGYLEMLLNHYFSKGETSKPYINVITPSDYKQRGCQLSLVFGNCSTTEDEIWIVEKLIHPLCDGDAVIHGGPKVFNKIKKYGVVCTLREPNVMRIVPVPLYNSFHDVFQFVEILKNVLLQCKL